MADDYSKYYQSVATYNNCNVAALVNQNPFISKVCNKNYQYFDRKMPQNLGMSLNVALPQSVSSTTGLVARSQAITQPFASLTITGMANSSVEASNQEFMFNLDKDSNGIKWFEESGKAMVNSLGSDIEIDVARHINSSAINGVEGTDTYLQKNYLSGPTRFYDGITTPLDSYQKLAQAEANFVSLGCPKDNHSMILPGTMVPAIVGSGLTQFVIDRNKELAQSWKVGSFGTPSTEYYISNQLPIQTAGTASQSSFDGTINSGTPFAIKSFVNTQPNNITTIVLNSGSAIEGQTILAGDMGWLLPASKLYATTFVGHSITSQPVQFRVIADAVVDSSKDIQIQIITNTYNQGQGLNGIAGDPWQNMSGQLAAGMTVKFMGSHRCGLRTAGNTFYLAMPPLKKEFPWASDVKIDDNTKASLRLTYGAVGIGQNQDRFVLSGIWGALLLGGHYSERICIPV